MQTIAAELEQLMLEIAADKEGAELADQLLETVNMLLKTGGSLQSALAHARQAWQIFADPVDKERAVHCGLTVLYKAGKLGRIVHFYGRLELADAETQLWRDLALFKLKKANFPRPACIYDAALLRKLGNAVLLEYARLAFSVGLTIEARIAAKASVEFAWDTEQKWIIAESWLKDLEYERAAAHYYWMYKESEYDSELYKKVIECLLLAGKINYAIQVTHFVPRKQILHYLYLFNLAVIIGDIDTLRDCLRKIGFVHKERRLLYYTRLAIYLHLRQKDKAARMAAQKARRFFEAKLHPAAKELMLEIIYAFAKWLTVYAGKSDFAYAGQLVYLPVVEARMMQAVMTSHSRAGANPAAGLPGIQKTASWFSNPLHAKLRRKIKAVLIFLSILAIGYLIYLESLEYLNR
ncbi:MAG: hypothetical protein KDK39_14345 [Leptospiraceae bacterium]|nr:hypothetical protein [Leptospiraceae bacterium]